MMKRIIFLIFLILVGCTSQNIKSLQAVEITDYQGDKLSSIGDFRENSIKGPQYINISEYSLEIRDNNYSYEEILNHTKYSKVVRLDCVEGWSANILWEGVLIKDILDNVNASTIIFYAYDGYSTSFPIEYVLNNDIILAYKMNNVTIPPERGFPFQLVAESKWGYKWIKWITKIELSNESYEGFWEQRGYANSGDLNKSFYE